jgi:hypothetical protein
VLDFLLLLIDLVLVVVVAVEEEMEEGWLSITSMTPPLLSIAIASELVRVLAMLELGCCCSKVFKVVSPFMEVLPPPR